MVERVGGARRPRSSGPGFLSAAVCLLLAAAAVPVLAQSRQPLPERMNRDAAELERTSRGTGESARTSVDTVEPARNWEVRPSLRVGITATNNSGVTDRQSLGSDAILEVTPRVELRHVGGGLKVDGQVPVCRPRRRGIGLEHG